MSGVRRYEWVRNGMASVDGHPKTIPWCENTEYVSSTDYDALLREREELLAVKASIAHCRKCGWPRFTHNNTGESWKCADCGHEWTGASATSGKRHEALVAALRTYGTHHGDCESRLPFNPPRGFNRRPCSCGLDAALASVPA